METTNKRPIKVLYVPYFQETRDSLRHKFVKGEAQKWIPLAYSLLVRPEFASCSLPTRYVFVAILLVCGTLGSDEITANTRYLANVLGADERTVKKAVAELLAVKLLTERKEKKEKKEKRKDHTAAEQSENAAGAEAENDAAAVCADFNFIRDKAEPEAEEFSNAARSGDGHLSQFTLEECLNYVNLCAAKGEDIRNPKGLATSLFRTGKSDAFIRAALFPDEQPEADLKTYGSPVRFSVEPCSVCFGAKMADADGKGYRKCAHCKNERGHSTGFEPEDLNKTLNT